jgi:hypothetical protein
MSNPINGAAVNFGFATQTGGITVTGFTGYLQTADQSAVADCDVTRDGLGAEVTHGWYNDHEEANLEWVLYSTGIAAARTATTLASLRPGTFFVISACASMPDLVATTWELQSGPKISGSNTTAKKITFPIKKFAGITAAASA